MSLRLRIMLPCFPLEQKLVEHKNSQNAMIKTAFNLNYFVLEGYKFGIAARTFSNFGLAKGSLGLRSSIMELCLMLRISVLYR